MANTTKNAGSGANGTVGSATWGTPNNILQSNNNYAAAVVYGISSKDLDCTDFQFNLPPGAIVAGIEVSVERFSIGEVLDLSIKLLNADGAGGESSIDRSAGATWSATEGVVTFGGPTDTWGETWSTSEINSSNFGVRIQCEGTASTYNSDTAYIDNVQITVYFDSNIKAGNLEVKEVRIGANPALNIGAGATVI